MIPKLGLYEIWVLCFTGFSCIISLVLTYTNLHRLLCFTLSFKSGLIEKMKAELSQNCSILLGLSSEPWVCKIHMALMQNCKSLAHLRCFYLHTNFLVISNNGRWNDEKVHGSSKFRRNMFENTHTHTHT